MDGDSANTDPAQTAPHSPAQILQPRHYFDTAAAAPPAPEALRAAVDYLEQTASLGPYWPSLRTEVYASIETVRERVAAFVQAEPGELAFTRNGTEAICLVARGLHWEPGDQVILPDTEMLSNIAIWRMLEAELGVTITPVRANRDGIIDPHSVRDAITDRTKIITFAALSNVTGAVQPVREICEIARDRGVLTHVNAAQALGIMPVGLSDWRCDFISACARKGLRGIEGSGILVVRKPLIQRLTPVLAGWWNASVDPASGAVTFPDTARRFEAGSPNVPAILALGAAAEAAEEVGIARTRYRIAALTEYAGTQLRRIPGAEVYGPRDDRDRLGILPFNIAGVDPAILSAGLAQRGIVIEAGHFMATSILAAFDIEQMARISLHAFNSTDEIDALIQAINAVKGTVT